MSENFHEQLSAHFDGEESSLRLDTLFSDDQQVDLASFEHIRETIAAPAPINAAAKDQHIAAALQTFDPVSITAKSNVIGLGVASQEKPHTEPARKGHQKWFTLAAALIVCVAGAFAFYTSSSFFDDQRDTASESVTAEAETSDSLQLNQQFDTESADEDAMPADDAAAEGEESMQEPSAARMQDFASDESGAAAAPESKTAAQAGEQNSDEMKDKEEVAPLTTTTARLQTTLQPPLASAPSYTPKKHAGSSDLEKNTAISSSACGEILEKQGFVLDSYAETTIDGIAGELFFLSNETINNEIFVDRNCVQYE